MSKPRVFISSTYYDLKHIRAALENFIESLGFEAILSEKGDIAYSPDKPLDESCYREVSNSDIFILIIGGRYGSASSAQKVNSPQKKINHKKQVSTRVTKASQRMNTKAPSNRSLSIF